MKISINIKVIGQALTIVIFVKKGHYVDLEKKIQSTFLMR